MAGYYALIGKSVGVSDRIAQFVVTFSHPSKLANYSNYTDYFPLLNSYILKTDNSQSLHKILQNLLSYLGQTETESYNFAITPQLAHSIGHLVLNCRDMVVNLGVVEFVARVAGKKEEVRGYLSLYQPWYVFLLLHYVYVSAPAIREFLLNKKMYFSFMLVLFSTKLTTKLQRKVSVLAAQELLIYEEDPKLREEIIKYCIAKLK